jgi:hypothetical protein
LFFVLLVAKLWDQIDLSWWWVTAPLWGPFALVCGGYALLALGFIAVASWDRITLDKATRQRMKANRAARKALDDYAQSIARRSR